MITAPVYVTKYGLTEGILKFSHGKIVEAGDYFTHGGVFVGSKDWCYDLNDAEERVREMAKKKIKSLEKSISKMQKIASSEHPPVKNWGTP